MFVLITLFGIWLGWNVNAVRERESLFKSWHMDRGHFGYIGEAHGVYIGEAHGVSVWAIRGDDNTYLPLVWDMLGAVPIRHILISRRQFPDDELQRIGRLFPEAELNYWETDRE